MKLERTLFPLQFTILSSHACSTSLGPAHVAGLNEAKRVVDAQRRQNANVALGEHLHVARAALDSESSDDRRGSSAAQAAGRVERIDAEELVDEAARDAEHGRTAVLTLHVQSMLNLTRPSNCRTW